MMGASPRRCQRGTTVVSDFRLAYDTAIMQDKQFDIVPDQQAIDQMEREFRFRPSPVAAPAALTRSQVEAFNRDGCLPRLPVFDPDEAAANRRYFDQLLEETLAAGGDSYSISTAHLEHGRGVRPADRAADRLLREGSAGRRCHRLGVPLLL